jgi:hypothetical protein
MTSTAEQIAEILRAHHVRENRGWSVDHLAAAVAEALQVPDRQFIDDLGRRWEWCGGVEGTWAWRVTGASDGSDPSRDYIKAAREYLEQAQGLNEAEMQGHAFFTLGCAVNMLIEHLAKESKR